MDFFDYIKKKERLTQMCFYFLLLKFEIVEFIMCRWAALTYKNQPWKNEHKIANPEGCSSKTISDLIRGLKTKGAYEGSFAALLN